MSKQKEQCETCRFWVLWQDSAIDKAADSQHRLYGQCKRYPPTQLENDEQARPDTTEEDWCGEWLLSKRSD